MLALDLSIFIDLTKNNFFQILGGKQEQEMFSANQST